MGVFITQSWWWDHSSILCKRTWPAGEQLPFSLTTRFFCVLGKQKGMPSLLKTTANAIYMVPVATLCKGNERMTRIKILCDLSQQQMGNVIEWAQKKSESPSWVERAQQKTVIKWINPLGPTGEPADATAWTPPGIKWEVRSDTRWWYYTSWRSKKNPISLNLKGFWKKAEISLSSGHVFVTAEDLQLKPGEVILIFGGPFFHL